MAWHCLALLLSRQMLCRWRPLLRRKFSFSNKVCIVAPTCNDISRSTCMLQLKVPAYLKGIW